jgi:5'-3' exonuclease
MRVHLLDGTYELFRHYFAVPKKEVDGREIGALRGVLGSVIGMLEGGATHLAVATDHVIESFRNAMYPGYKSSAGVPQDLLDQFWPLEDALRALGVVTWAMTDVEADDALASGAAIAARDDRVDQVLICTPDKDVAQCVVDELVVQFDRRKREIRDEAAVIAKFGVRPSSIPDYLGLVGDPSDGFPGVKGWGATSAAAVLARYGHIENIPDDARAWDVQIRGRDKLAATLRDDREFANLCKDLATLRIDDELITSVDELEWHGPGPSFSDIAATLNEPELAKRADALASRR